MFYLEGSIAGQLKWLYPTAPERADAWLEQEIFRWVLLILVAYHIFNGVCASV